MHDWNQPEQEQEQKEWQPLSFLLKLNPTFSSVFRVQCKSESESERVEDPRGNNIIRTTWKMSAYVNKYVHA